MKSATNKFDYPTAATHGYKFYPQQPQPHNKSQAFRQRYKQINQQQRQNERAKVKIEQERKKQVQRRENKRKLQAEIENKKRELQQLEKAKNLALQAQRQAHELALVKQEQDRIKAEQQQQKIKQNQIMAQNRFITALKRMQIEKDIANKKNKEAQFRRKTADETQKIQRNKAIKYRQTIQEAEKNFVPEQKTSFKNYKQPLGRVAYNHTVDYTKTYLHNPLIIVPNQQNDECNAIEKAEQKNQKNKQKQQKLKQLNDENHRISIERGEKALQKIKLERQYEQYRRQEQANALRYNIQRIQAGKKNQYIGVKPATLSQMESQRKIRRQQEFEEIFFGGKTPQWFDKPAGQYKIQEARLGNTYIPVKQRQISTGNARSNQAVISNGHYSFQSQGIDNLTTVKKEDPNGNPYEGGRENMQGSMNPLQEYQHKRMNDNYSSKHRQELSYSESEEDSCT